MKEKRVYVIPNFVMWNTYWYDHLGIEDVDESDYGLISDEIWMEKAESAGLVYTLEGFVKAWIEDSVFLSRKNNYARIIEV